MEIWMSPTAPDDLTKFSSINKCGSLDSGDIHSTNSPDEIFEINKMASVRVDR